RNLDPPLLECRPLSGSGSAPVCFRALPQTPSLFDADILIGVIHHRVEPSAGLRTGKVFRRDSFLEKLPNRLMVGRVIPIEKARAACSQFRAYVVWNVATSVNDSSNPENESVPFDVLIGGRCQFTPRHKQSILEGSVFAVESNVENETVEV